MRGSLDLLQFIDVLADYDAAGAMALPFPPLLTDLG
jgi:hypothetical protein